MERMLKDILHRFPGKRVLVIGDLMLDEYIWGSVRRISPEAPVPVVELQKRSHAPGGAANAAANIAGLQGQVDLVGIIGADEAGNQLRRALASRGIGVDGLVTAEGRPTTTKTRIIAHSQQVVRLDQEHRVRFDAKLEEQLIRLIEERLPRADVCLLSDYAKGLVSPTLARGFIERAVALGKPVVVDPKGGDGSKYRGATVIKPNLDEAAILLKQEIQSPEEVTEAGPRLVSLFGSTGVLITRGAAGMSLFQVGREPIHIPAQAREVFDVTGAGDTVVSTLAMALAAGADLEQGARLASQAAAIIVGRVGTTAVRLEELLNEAVAVK
jgi:D-glycero-beta-D-manno-heptose-7-phosphate kinase